MVEDILYERVAREMAGRIEGMEQGERLPSVRQLAAELNVSHSTVIAAYRALMQAGLCYARPRSGMFAMPPGGETGPAPEEAPAGIDLMSGVPGAEAFPFAAFKAAIGEVLDGDREQAFTYQPGCGYEGLREAIAAMMVRRGARCKAENVLVTSGAQQALDVAARHLLRRESATVCMENPSYPGARAAFAAQGARILGIPVGEKGMDLDLLRGFARRERPALVYTMPLLQTPTTACMDEGDMAKLCELAEEYDFLILEEDALSELMEVPRAPLYAMAPERVIHIKSFSKILMPGIRTGFLLAPANTVAALDRVKRESELSAAGLIQRALCRFLESEAYGSHVNDLRALFRARSAVAMEHVKVWEKMGVHTAAGGMDLWLTLPEGVRDGEIAGECRRAGVLVGPGSRYYCAPMARMDRHIRLSVAAVGEEALSEGFAAVGEALRHAVSRRAGKLYIG